MREDELRRKLTMVVENTRLEVFAEVVVASYLLNRVQVNPFKFEEDLYNSIAKGVEIAIALQKIICNEYNVSYTPYRSIKIILRDGDFAFTISTLNISHEISYISEQGLTMDLYVHRLFELPWIHITSTIVGMILDEFICTKKLGKLNQNLITYDLPNHFLSQMFPSNLNEVMLGLIVFSELIGQSDSNLFKSMLPILPHIPSAQTYFTFSTYEDKNNLLLKLIAKSLASQLVQYEISNIAPKVQEAALKFSLGEPLNVFQKQMIRNLNVKVTLDRGVVYTVQNVPTDVVYVKNIVILA